MTRAGISVDRLAELVQVDPKTVWRWANKGVVPRRVGLKGRVADALGVDPSDLWPAPAPGPALSEDREVTEEVVAVWSHRADIPKARWWSILTAAEESIDLLGYAMQFLPEDHARFDRLLIEKAATGLSDPHRPRRSRLTVRRRAGRGGGPRRHLLGSHPIDARPLRGAVRRRRG